jgi:hypothetical protein
LRIVERNCVSSVYWVEVESRVTRARHEVI